MGASEEDHNVYNPEDLDDDEEDEEESGDIVHASHNNKISIMANDNMIINPSENNVVADDEDDDVDVDVDVDADEDDDVDDSTSSSNLAAAADDDRHLPDPSSLRSHQHHFPPPPSVATGEVIVVLPADRSLLPDAKRQRSDEVTIASASASAVAKAVVEEKKPVPNDESRRLFQRLWTDEDEIELLQGFLEYTASRGVINSSHHHDTTAFYDQIKSKLQLDFNKNQLVEKLRRLKKKYRNVMNKMGSGKEYVFKSPHDQATFEISRKIWGGSGGGAAVRGGVVVEEGGFEDDDGNPNFNINYIDQSPTPNFNGIDNLEKKTPRSRKRSRGSGVKIEEKPFGFTSFPHVQNSSRQQQQQNVQNMQNVGVVTPTSTPIPIEAATAAAAGGSAGSGQATNLIEETVRSCLSPIFKELLNSVMSLNGPMMGGPRGFGFALTPMPLGLNGVADEKWRKQQILELEVYSKRLELVQDQIKAQLEQLRSVGSW